MGFQFTPDDLVLAEQKNVPSKIALEARRLDKLSRSSQVKRSLDQKIRDHLQDRQALVHELQDLGLKVQNVKYPNEGSNGTQSPEYSEAYVTVPKKPEVYQMVGELGFTLQAREDDIRISGFTASRFQYQLKEIEAVLAEHEMKALRVERPKLKTDHLKDHSQVDDAGKSLETTVRVAAFTAEQIEKVYTFAKEKNMGVMTIGAKTSALGVFESEADARLRGLNGVIGIEMPASWDENQTVLQGMSQDGIPHELLSYSENKLVSAQPSHHLLVLPEEDHLAEGEELILSEKLPMAIVKSSEGKHRVIAHSTVTVSQVNSFLKENLSDEYFRYQIMPDLTSKEQAALGGVITTGAQGGNRTSARVDIASCLVVDASGSRTLHGADAQSIVGNNGYTGTVVQASFEVTPVPKYPFGLVFMIPGENEQERWKNLLALQQRLTPHGIPPTAVGPDDDQPSFHLSGMEILGRDPLLGGMDKKKGPNTATEMASLRPLVDSDKGKDTQLYLYVTGSSIYDLTDADGLADFLFSDMCEESLSVKEDENEEYMDDQDFLSIDPDKKQKLPFSDVALVSNDKVLKLLDEIRHLAPEIARGEATKLGGVTYSTDFNIQFTSSDEEANRRAHDTVAQIFAEYEAAFRDGPYRVDFYGHAYNGMAESPLGGGFDPHVRITLELNNPETRYDAPERVLEIESLRKKLYQKLLLLDGVDGIVVAPPEKSHLTNSSYYQWLRIFYPERVEALEHAVFADSIDDTDRLLSAFRVPIELPREPRRGILSFLSKALVDQDADPQNMKTYAEAILKLSQEKHRGPRVKGLFREVMASLREKLHLDPHRQPSLYAGSLEKAQYILQQEEINSDISVRVIDEDIDLATLEPGSFGEHEIVLIPSEHLGGMKGACMMITPLSVIQSSYLNGGPLAEMHAKYPYETPETPNVPAMAALGLALQRAELSFDALDASDDGQRLTLNPGPTQIDDVLLKHVRDHGFNDLPLDGEAYSEIVDDIRGFLKMPEHMSLAFTPSATDAMRLFADSIVQHADALAITQVTNGNFANRFHDIMVKAGVEVNRLSTPWTTSESSQMPFLIDKFVGAILDAREEGKKPVFVMTPHKTSTTAHFHPDIIVNALQQCGGFQPGKDYEMLCDFTSGVGAVDYFQGQEHESLSWFGGVQKALGCPPGLGMVSLSPFMQSLFLNDDEHSFSMKAVHEQASRHELHNPALLRLLGVKVGHELLIERDVATVATEVRQRMNIVLGFLALHPELCLQVPDPKDQSPLLAGIYSISRNLKQAARLMDEIFGLEIGSGYGPYKDEAIRMYLANVTDDELRAFLLTLERCMEFSSVTQTVNPKVPIKTLREPHDPLVVLEDLVLDHEVGLVADDLWRYSLALQWVNRLLFTKREGEASIYGSEENVKMMQQIMDTRLGKNEPSLFDSHDSVNTLIQECYDILLNGDESKLGTIPKKLNDIFGHFKTIVLTLQKYARVAPQTAERRPAWPITATEVQLETKRNGNGKH